ncbi:MAG TPA: DUF4340 domain-containing protein [Chthoniobacterales bacterium]|nr:DUF4340 domain-containing protein [Chthoniobacterales bacterium]
MKSKTTLILLVVVVALALWIKFYESKQPNTEERKRLAGNVVNFEEDDLEGILIQNGDDRIELRKSDEKWRLEAPIKDQADSSLVDALVGALQSWQKDETISEEEIEKDKGRLEEYDLEKPKLRVKLQGKEMPPDILFGKDAALEGKMYVRLANSKDSFLVSQRVKTNVTKKAEEFRDRKLTDVSNAEVSRVALKTPAGEMELQKQGEQWEITRPLRARGDNQKIGDLISQVTAARIQQFVAEAGGDLQPYGLTEPRGSITLFKQDDKSANRTDSSSEGARVLQIGGTPPEQQDQVYVRFSARNFVYTLPKKIEEILNTKPADLRDRHLVRFDTNLLDRITIDAPGKGKTVLARKDQAWTIASRDNQLANNTEVTRLLDTLKNEQVTRFVEDVASDLPKYGLDNPQLQVTLSSFASENTAETAAGEKPIATIAFGNADGDNVFARIGEEPFIVAVRKALLDQIFTDPAKWQELAIFKFKPEDLKRLSVTTDKEATLTRAANNEWTRPEGNEPINQVNVQSLLNTLSDLRAVRWESTATPPQAFDKPQITITFTTSADDKTLHKLIVGGPAGGGMWFGRVEGREGVFVLSNPDFNALRLPVGEPPPAPAAPQPPPPSATP